MKTVAVRKIQRPDASVVKRLGAPLADAKLRARSAGK